MVRAEGLGKRLGTRQAVWDITFSLAAGRVLGVVGPNGCGKTTLLKVLATLLAPSAGRAWIGEDLITERPDLVRRRVGYMPDGLVVYPDLTVLGVLEFFAACYDVPRNERGPLLQDLLELVDLGAVATEPVGSLSGGMSRRLALARCLVHSPDVLLLDNPAAGLDARVRGELWELIRELQSLNKTIILASRAMDDLADICTDLAIMNGGRFVAVGPLAEVVGRAARTGVLRLRVAGDPDVAAAALKGVPWVGAVAAEGGLLRASYVGGQTAADALLQALVAARIPVTEYDVGGPGLEETVRRYAEGVVR